MRIQATLPRGERRSLIRHDCTAPAWRALVGEDLQFGLIRDISPAGIGLLLDRQIDPNQRLRIELQSKTGALWHLKVLDVVHATPQNDAAWIVGGAFPSPLTHDQLQALMS